MTIDTSLHWSLYTILIAFIMPLGMSFIAKTLGGFKIDDNKTPREFLARTSGMAARAHDAHANSFEIFPFFLGSVILAILFSVSASTINWCAWLFVLFRILFILAYLFDKSVLRSTLWVVSAFFPTYLIICCLSQNHQSLI